MKRYEYIDAASQERDPSLGLSYAEPVPAQTFWRRRPNTFGAKTRYLVRRINYDAKIAYCVPFEGATPEEEATNLRLYNGADFRPWD